VNTLETSTVFTLVRWERTCAMVQKTGPCPNVVRVPDLPKSEHDMELKAEKRFRDWCLQSSEGKGLI